MDTSSLIAIISVAMPLVISLSVFIFNAIIDKRIDQRLKPVHNHYLLVDSQITQLQQRLALVQAEVFGKADTFSRWEGDGE